MAGKIVHESEAHRQHVRIRLPGTVVVRDSNGDRIADFPLLDISVGGFSLQPGAVSLADGGIYDASLVLKYETFTYSIDIRCQVLKTTSDRIGCVFQDIGATEGDALRAVIGSFLAGDVLQLNDMLQIVKRDNSAAARKGGAGDNPPVVKGVALAGTFAVFLLGVLALGYVMSQVYSVLFLTSAESAVVTTNVQFLRMPVDASFQSLLETGQRQVAKGQPLGTYRELLPPVPARGEPQDEPRQVTIFSPCDCEVISLPLGEAGVLRRGDPVFQLRDRASVRWVAGLFLPAQARELAPGDLVRVHLPGLDLTFNGHVRLLDAARLDNSQVADGHVRIDVDIDGTLPADALGHPVEVVRHPWLVMQALALLPTDSP